MQSKGIMYPNFIVTSQARSEQSNSARAHGIGGIGAVVAAPHCGSAQTTRSRRMIRCRT